MYRRKKKIEELVISLAEQAKEIHKIKEKLWILENPSKYKRGDKIAHFIITDIEVGYCFGNQWLYTVFDTKKKKSTKKWETDLSFIIASFKKEEKINHEKERLE